MKKNITPIIGLFLGIFLVVWSIVTAGDIMGFVDFPSILITVGGSIAGLIIVYSKDDLKKIPVLFKILTSDSSIDKIEVVNIFLEVSKKARGSGILSLEDEIEKIDNELIKDGLRMVVDGTETEEIQDILELKLIAMERRHSQGQDILLKWGEYAPAFGMIGTLIGLIIMLTDLDDPSLIGSGMATALLTTLYGSLLANLFFIPVATNLASKTEEEIYVGNMIIEGVVGVQSGSNSRVIEDKLVNYLSPEEREKYKNTETNVSKEKVYG